MPTSEVCLTAPKHHSIVVSVILAVINVGMIVGFVRQRFCRVTGVWCGRVLVVCRMVSSLLQFAIHAPTNIDRWAKVLGGDDWCHGCNHSPADTVAENPHFRSKTGFNINDVC